MENVQNEQKKLDDERKQIQQQIQQQSQQMAEQMYQERIKKEEKLSVIVQKRKENLAELNKGRQKHMPTLEQQQQDRNRNQNQRQQRQHIER